MKKVLVTGFEPFGNDTVNLALEVVKALANEKIPNVNLVTLILPVVFGKAIEALKAAIEREQPELVISLGQAGDRNAINVEKLGININHARIADNEGNQPNEEMIDPTGPAAYFTTIKISNTVESIKEAEIPAKVSFSAGTYVCNNLIYGIMHYLYSSKKHEKIKYGFIHIPYLPSIPLNLIKKAVQITIQANI
ncbi:MAG: pyroglutamyl-peptidase I [Candidatus Heimdallarchaeota archaeon]